MEVCWTTALAKTTLPADHADKASLEFQKIWRFLSPGQAGSGVQQGAISEARAICVRARVVVMSGMVMANATSHIHDYDVRDDHDHRENGDGLVI